MFEPDSPQVPWMAHRGEKSTQLASHHRPCFCPHQLQHVGSHRHALAEGSRSEASCRRMPGSHPLAESLAPQVKGPPSQDTRSAGSLANGQHPAKNLRFQWVHCMDHPSAKSLELHQGSFHHVGLLPLKQHHHDQLHQPSLNHQLDHRDHHLQWPVVAPRLQHVQQHRVWIPGPPKRHQRYPKWAEGLLPAKPANSDSPKIVLRRLTLGRSNHLEQHERYLGNVSVIKLYSCIFLHCYSHVIVIAIFNG